MRDYAFRAMSSGTLDPVHEDAVVRGCAPRRALCGEVSFHKQSDSSTLASVGRGEQVFSQAIWGWVCYPSKILPPLSLFYLDSLNSGKRSIPAKSALPNTSMDTLLEERLLQRSSRSFLHCLRVINLSSLGQKRKGFYFQGKFKMRQDQVSVLRCFLDFVCS